MLIDKEPLDRLLKASLARRDKWDEPPDLGVIYRSATNVARLTSWGIEKRVWDASHPRNFLKYFADCLINDSPENRAVIVSGIIPEGAVALGVYFRYEGYAPPADQAEELRKRRMAGGSTPRFKDVPGRREYRMILAVTFGLLERGALQFRETPQQPPHEYAVLDGPVQESLIRIATVLAPEENHS